MKKLLSVATAAIHPGQSAESNNLHFPRVDYIELQRLLDAETLDYSAYNSNFTGKFLRRLETELRSDIYLATLGWRKSMHYPLLFAWSERAGIPLASYKQLTRSRSRFVSMFQCWSERQELAIRTLNLLSVMDTILVHCHSMRDRLISLGAHPDRVKVVHYSIDQHFFSPLTDVNRKPNLVVSVGEPRSRDYSALFSAFETIPATLEVAGYGHWYAREKYSTHETNLPTNVIRHRQLSYFELKQLYASAQCIVLPVRDLVYSAGATAYLEAASMRRAVIAFHSKGISDYIINGETGILVESGNVQAMRDAIQYLLAHPKEAKRLGDNAYQRVLDELNLETYVRNIADVLIQNLPQVGKRLANYESGVPS